MDYIVGFIVGLLVNKIKKLLNYISRKDWEAIREKEWDFFDYD